MGVTENRMRMIASQPHKFSAAGETLYVNIGEPKIGKLEVVFTPRQGGIGMPSPTNPRPIYGWSEIKAQFHTGKNLFDKNNVEIGKNIGTDGSISDSANARLTDYIPINGQCVFWAVKSGTTRLRLGLFDRGKGWLRRIISEYDGDLDVAIVNDPQVAYVRACLFTSSDDIDTAMLELGTERTTFEPYQGTTATVDLGGTRYGGTVDLVSGTMTVTWDNIASYSGQTLPGRWLSSKDAYSSGGTPTTGAQVAYELATPQTIQLDPQTISLLRKQYTVRETANNHVAIDYWTYQRSQEPELPSGYTRLNYIQSQGTAYIDTGLILHSGYVITLDLEVATTTANCAFWGYRWKGSYTDPYQCYVQTNTGRNHVFFGTNFRGHGNDDAFPFNQRFTMVIDSTNGIVTLDGQKITVNIDVANIADENGSSVKIPYLGAFNCVTYAATTNNVAKYYGYTVKENGAVIQHFIPAIDPNGVYGMFDTISQSFFKSAVSEQFIGG